jgi:hypothetical protein
VSVWVRPAAFPAPHGMNVVKKDSGSDWHQQRLCLVVRKGACAQFGVADGSRHNVVGTRGGGMKTGVWYHVVGTFDGKHLRIYLNGKQVSYVRQTVAPKMRGLPLWIGYGRGFPPEYFRGLMDEVMVFDRALSPTEVEALYASQAG